jgi:hypothetical protein
MQGIRASYVQEISDVLDAITGIDACSGYGRSPPLTNIFEKSGLKSG